MKVSRKKSIKALLSMAEALSKHSRHLGGLRDQREFGRWLAEALTKAGPHATLGGVTDVMRMSGVSMIRVCGCRDETLCLDHQRETRERAKREAANHSCPCGLLDELTKLAAECHRSGDEEGAERNAKVRAAHVCPGSPLPATADMVLRQRWRELRAAEEERLWGML